MCFCINLNSLALHLAARNFGKLCFHFFPKKTLISMHMRWLPFHCTTYMKVVNVQFDLTLEYDKFIALKHLFNDLFSIVKLLLMIHRKRQIKQKLRVQSRR